MIKNYKKWTDIIYTYYQIKTIKLSDSQTLHHRLSQRSVHQSFGWAGFALDGYFDTGKVARCSHWYFR